LHGMRNKEAHMVVADRPHQVRLEFFEKGGAAGMVLKYSGPDSSNKMIIIPGNSFQQMAGENSHRTGGLKEEIFYFDQGASLRGLNSHRPAKVRVAKTVNYAATKRGWPGFSRSDQFAVRWSGFLLILKGGDYVFSLTSDDGSRLRIGGKLVVSNDGLHGMRSREGKTSLRTGKYPVVIEFFEKHGNAGMIFKYRGPDAGKLNVVVPQRALVSQFAIDHIQKKMAVAHR